jgi:ABC-type nickel/cobalt efflux system permease component RcnA
MLTLITGFLAGFAHVLTGPDHLAAVTPFSLNLRKKAWLIGLTWGTGHTLGAILIGLVFVAFKEIFPLELVSKYSDTLVGVLLIGIGSWAIWKVFRPVPPGSHSHPHIHANSEAYIHIHRHDHGVNHQHLHLHEKTRRQNILTAFLIGILHGFAGFSHLVAVLPSLVLPGTREPVLYLSSFGAGTIITMVGFTMLLGLLAHRMEQKQQIQFLKRASLAGGILALLVGLLWLVHPF